MPVANTTMLHKINNNLKFQRKRNKNLITPCCHKKNTDGKFVNFEEYPGIYGYCHSCGKTCPPPSVYVNELGEKFIWNETTKQLENTVLNSSYKHVTQNKEASEKLYDEKELQKLENTQYVNFEIVNCFYNNKKENNLLKFLRKTYSKESVDNVKKMYYIGTNKNLGAVFWMINKEGKAQKVKVIYYDIKGKRTAYFKIPYLDDDGYRSCLFGEHLLKDNTEPIILVESEKTAIVAKIELPNYTWLSYGGATGLTDHKLKVLSGESVIIIPDMSENAVSIMENKRARFEEFNIDVRIFDMTDGKSDEELKKSGWYNCDIEDVIRRNFANYSQ